MKPDLFTILLWLAYVAIGAGAAAVIVFLFVSVVFLGGGSSCPQNLCP
jgi:hypothetical protein